MEPQYIIVQAGGKGTRLEHLTANKPKALVPIGNLPMLFHLFQKYPDKRYIIIGDYKQDVLKRYLQAFATVNYLFVNGEGHYGTCAGIKKALNYLPDGEGVLLIWSDLVLPANFTFPEEKGNYLGLSGNFSCRWKYENGQLSEEPSEEFGVAGLFLFQDKETIAEVPEDGEFVRWLSQSGIDLNPMQLCGAKEYGLLSAYQKQGISKCRSFNQITVKNGRLTKKGVTEQGERLAALEKNWYKCIGELEFPATPAIYSYTPFVMEYVPGKAVFEYDMSATEKQIVLEKIVAMLKHLHRLGSAPTDYFSMEEAYLNKTFDRLFKIRDLVPFANNESIVINGKRCRNVFFCRNELENRLHSFECRQFVLLHGDCTFSNILLREGRDPVLIDPRGYFGHTELYGDCAYDWAKLYYSIVGNYDRFNAKDFQLTIGAQDVTIQIGSNGWEAMEELFLQLVADEIGREQLRLIHALIWLSLTTYAWEDYDSICGAFYNGLLYLEDTLKK